MSAPAQCPLCNTRLEPDWESCPNCPMSFTERSPDKTTLQSDGFRSFGVPILIFGGLAYGLWTASQYLWRSAQEGAKTVHVIKKPAQEVSSPVPGPEFLPEGAEENKGQGAAGTEPGSRPSRAPGTISVMPVDRTGGKSDGEWKMRGVIYDLITLEPVPGVHMIFLDNLTNSRAQIVTDAQGRYRAVLPSLPGRGYFISLSKTGYEKSYLNPGTEGVSEMPLEQRKELAHDLATLIAEPAALQPNGDTPLVTDFHMAPR
ncbi:MAG: hypothetical protein COV48_00445 [Elusimicrobia bacterium CG11_big_fil_rev_8_21_14_0_20_64_6]|nr:MAG: hypothetical protein COV48_00445 [Elusimicrobia bacterium CG11_big_fil_rev_8_21_14_0_20_64_6]